MPVHRPKGRFAAGSLQLESALATFPESLVETRLGLVEVRVALGLLESRRRVRLSAFVVELAIEELWDGCGCLLICLLGGLSCEGLAAPRAYDCLRHFSG